MLDPPSPNPSPHSKPFSKALRTLRHATTNGRIPPEAQRRKPRPEAPGSDAARQPLLPTAVPTGAAPAGTALPVRLFPRTVQNSSVPRGSRSGSAARPGSPPGAPRSPARRRPRDSRTHSPGASSWGPSLRGSWPCRRLWPRPSR